MSDARYLLIIYQLAGPAGDRVASGRVAAELGRSPSTATEKLQRLGDRGLVDYQPYEGVRLTDEGRRQAAELHESYLVLRRFFGEVLELDDPEAEALELAGSVSPVVTDRLATTVLGVETAQLHQGSTAAHSEERSDG
ncbi:MAG: metal-dependent transcriptional regulator [Halohasta sp.]